MLCEQIVIEPLFLRFLQLYLHRRYRSIQKAPGFRRAQMGFMHKTGSAEGVKGATADIRLFSLPPCRSRRSEIPCHNKALYKKEVHKAMKKIFIIGGGIAALEAAKSARSTQRDALIVLISAENALPYSRPMLTKQLMGKVTAQDLAVESAAWYDEKDIVVLTGRTVTAIDPVGKTLVAGGTPFHWDSLILATGASCFVPPIPGADGANVVAVRTFGDVARVREIAKTAKNAAVIGGGVLGLEAASSLAEAGLSVTVLEHGDQLMKRQIDAQAAQHLESAMAGKGVKLLKNADSARIDASGVTLVDGTRVPAELVIVSAGVRANIRLAKDAGIAAERHITVDDHMRTNLPDVYAAGDCASMGVSYALWTEAADMGRIAGINAAGGDAAYQALPRPLIFHGFGTALFAFGDTGRQANISYEIDEMPGARYYSAGGKLVGAVLTGDIRRMEEVTNLILQA